MSKRDVIIGLSFLFVTLLIGSLFTASLKILAETDEVSWWLLPAVTGMIYFTILGVQFFGPLYRDYRKPRSQRQWDTIKTYYQIVIATVMIFTALCIALGGIWVYFYYSEQHGARMTGLGLTLLSVPLAYLIFKTIRLLRQ